ncbi:SHOCT domain-containing protein [Pelagibacterales bacterium]|nr:SHOCT domain-containing protein [Pelagibacterales bacterium]
MRNILIIIGTIIFSINISLATDIIKGEVYQNHLNKVFGTKMTVSLPPGKWKAVEVTVRKQYTSVEFDNNIDGALFFISIPNTQIAGDYFASSGVKKCKNKNDNGDKYTVHATGLIRNALQTSYCIQDIDYANGGDWLHIGLHAEKNQGSPLMSAYYNVYYPQKFSNINALNKNQLEVIGKSLMKVFKNNVQGKPGDYTMATQLLNFTSTSKITSNVTRSLTDSYIAKSNSNSSSSSLSNSSDMVVCAKAITLSGVDWDLQNANKIEYIKEAKSRKLTVESCRSLTGRLDYVTSKTVVETTSEEPGVKVKLKELKAILDEGLISQEQYDTKSTKLLEDF